MPQPRGGRIRRVGDLSSGYRRQSLRRARGCPHSSLSPGATDHGVPELRRRVRLQLARHRVVGAASVAPPSLRRDPSLQSSGHLLRARVAVQAVRRALRVRPTRPVPRGLPLSVRADEGARPARPACPRDRQLSHRGPRDHGERVLSRGGAGSRQGRCGSSERRPQWASSGSHASWRVGSGFEERPPAPVLLPRCDGAPGRGRSAWSVPSTCS